MDRFCEADPPREAVPATEEAERLAALFKVLADPTRIRLLTLLLDQELCVHELAEALEMQQPAVSHQLGKLRLQGLVKARKVGRHVFYTLDDDHVRDLLVRGWEHVGHRPGPGGPPRGGAEGTSEAKGGAIR